MGFLDEVGFEELTNLLTDHRRPLRVEPLMLLNDGLVGQIYAEPMDDDRWVNAGHIFMEQSKHVLVLF